MALALALATPQTAATQGFYVWPASPTVCQLVPLEAAFALSRKFIRIGNPDMTCGLHNRRTARDEIGRRVAGASRGGSFGASRSLPHWGSR